MNASKFSFKPPSEYRSSDGGIPKPRQARFQPAGGVPRQKPDVIVPAGANPDLPWVGAARYARFSDAIRRLEDAGFEDTVFGGEMVSLSGRFARIDMLGGSSGPCEVHIRLAQTMPRP